MAGSDSMVAVLAIGALGLGAIFLLPKLMKQESPRGDINYYYEEDVPRTRLPLVDLGDVVSTTGDNDDVYLITDEDFRKLDIGKKDRRWLNRERKLKDARLERVLYGDNPNMPYILPQFAGAYNVNTVSPYGQGSAKEFIRLPGASDQSLVNTQKNTINLY